MAAQTATKPEGPTGEFHGDIEVNNIPPNARMLESAAALPLLDQNNKKHSFKSLYEGKGRIIIVFVRHFFCGVGHFHSLSVDLDPQFLTVHVECRADDLPTK